MATPARAARATRTSAGQPPNRRRSTPGGRTPPPGARSRRRGRPARPRPPRRPGRRRGSRASGQVGAPGRPARGGRWPAARRRARRAPAAGAPVGDLVDVVEHGHTSSGASVATPRCRARAGRAPRHRGADGGGRPPPSATSWSWGARTSPMPGRRAGDRVGPARLGEERRLPEAGAGDDDGDRHRPAPREPSDEVGAGELAGQSRGWAAEAPHRGGPLHRLGDSPHRPLVRGTVDGGSGAGRTCELDPVGGVGLGGLLLRRDHLVLRRRAHRRRLGLVLGRGPRRCRLGLVLGTRHTWGSASQCWASASWASSRTFPCRSPAATPTLPASAVWRARPAA